MIISRSILLRMRNVSDRICREDKNTFNVKCLSFENRTAHEIVWKNTVEYGRQQMTIKSTLIACWISTATNTLDRKHHEVLRMYYEMKNNGTSSTTTFNMYG